MTALDLGTATRALAVPSAPFMSTSFGDVTLATEGSNPHPVALSAQGWAAIPRDWTVADTDMLANYSFAPADEWTLFVALENAAGLSGDVVTEGGAIRAVVSAGQVDSVRIAGVEVITTTALTTALGTGVSVLAIKGNGAGSGFFTDADGLVASGSGAASISPTYFAFSTLTGAALLLGAWTFEGTALSDTDIADTAAAIAASFEVPPTARVVSAVGSWGISAPAAAVEPTVVPDLPTPTIPAPGGTQTPPAKPAPATPSEMKAAGIYPLMHVWETMPATTVNEARAGGWEPTAYGAVELGYLQITVEGDDVTRWDGAETPFPTWRRGQPFGSQSAQIEFPQITPFHARPSWARHGANVSIDLVKISGDSVNLFSGFVMDVGDSVDSGVFTLQCMGSLFGADLIKRKPSAILAPKDIGSLIPALLNAVSSKRWLNMAKTVTGIKSSVSGGWEDLLTGFVQSVLATAIKDGRQYTINCRERTPVLEFKDTTTIVATFRTGQRGVTVDLNSDASQAPNVIYGSGVNPDGGGWSNWKYPNWSPDDTPAFPNSNPGDTLQLGRTDASTDSGDGVSAWQAKAGRPVTGYYSADDVLACKRLQRDRGILVDGVIGPQTWAATFDTGANTGTLDGAYVAPLAIATEVEPYLYGPDGDRLGANPAFDPNVIRVETVINYGRDVWRYEAIPNAEQVLVRDADPGWSGTISLEIDPETMSKYEVLEGMNLRLLDWHGEDLDLHIALGSYDANGATFDVDTQARDYPTLEAIRTRDREAVDPAKKAIKRLLEGQVQDGRATYDAESPAGRMPKHALFTNLWDVRRMPMGVEGRVVLTEFTTSGPATPFAVAIFGKPLTAADLVDAIGNPLVATEPPWESEDLDDMGLLQAWGWKEQRMGFYPKTDSNPNGKTAAPVTGKMVDDDTWGYVSAQPPWLWVAMIASAPCYIEGRIWGAPR